MRPLIKVILAIVILGVILGVIAGMFSTYEGVYECLICHKWKRVNKITFLGVSLKSNEYSPPQKEDYEKWYWENIGIEHEHHWRNTGGSHIKSLFGESWFDSFGTGPLFFSAIPYVPDKQIALAMAKRIALSSPEERLKLLKCFSFSMSCDCIKQIPRKQLDDLSISLSKPWLSLGGDKKMSLEDFHKSYQIWLKYHTVW
ncbi:MAG: hypothetical protein V1701_08660 [Planctomycetota bacterium]